MNDVTREEARECTLQCYEELKRELGRPPTLKELVELSGISIPVTRAFLTIAGKSLSNPRALRLGGHGT